MATPSINDYHAAIQNLRLTVSDAELQEGIVERGRAGMPKCYAGNFAYVYKVHCPKKARQRNRFRSTKRTWH